MSQVVGVNQRVVVLDTVNGCTITLILFKLLSPVLPHWRWGAYIQHLQLVPKSIVFLKLSTTEPTTAASVTFLHISNDVSTYMSVIHCLATDCDCGGSTQNGRAWLPCNVVLTDSSSLAIHFRHSAHKQILRTQRPMSGVREAGHIFVNSAHVHGERSEIVFLSWTFSL